MLANLAEVVETALDAIQSAQRWMAFWGPVTPAPAVVAPLLAVASVLMLALVTGIAVGSLATLIIALLALYLILTEVFGLSIDIATAVPPRR